MRTNLFQEINFTVATTILKIDLDNRIINEIYITSKISVASAFISVIEYKKNVSDLIFWHNFDSTTGRNFEKNMLQILSVPNSFYIAVHSKIATNLNALWITLNTGTWDDTIVMMR